VTDSGRVFRLRELAPEDGPALRELVESSPDTGMIRFRPVYQVDPYVAMTFGETLAGVVVEAEGQPGIVGVGLVSFEEVELRGARRPYALLHSLVVHPAVRRRGVASAIIAWRLARARARLGEDALLAATIQRSNEGSFRATGRWATQYSAELSSVVMRPTTTRPAERDGWRARPAQPEDLEAYAAGFATFRSGFDLRIPGDPAVLDEWLGRTPTPGTPIHALWVAEDGRRDLVAGLAISELRRATVLQIDAAPRSVRLLNRFVRVIPPGNRMEMVPVTRIWHRPGAEAAARHLFAVARHEATRHGNVVVTTFDPRSGLGRVVAPSRWNPKTAFTVALRAPQALRSDRPIDPVQ